MALHELGWALAARRAAAAGSRHTARARSCTPRSPRPCSPRGQGAIRFDAPAAGNRPGRHGMWQRPVERRRLAAAPLLVPWSEGGLAEAPRPGSTDAVVVPVPVAPSGRRPASATSRRSPTARTRPRRASTACSPPGGGAPARRRDARRRRPRRGRRAGRRATPGCCRATTTAPCSAARASSSPPPAARTTGSPSSRRSPTAARSSRRRRRARTPRCRSPARSTRASSATSLAIRVALDDPAPGYAERAAELLAPWRPDAVDRVVATELLPRLLRTPAG